MNIDRFVKTLKHKNTRTIVSVLVFVVCVGLLVRSVDFSMVLVNARKVNGFIFVFTVLISIFRTWLSGVRWEFLHPNANIGMSRWAYFRLSMLSFFFNLFMPGALGGDIVKTAYAMNEGEGQRVKKVIAVVMDRTVGLISILVLGMMALFASHQKLPVSMWQIFALFIVSGGFIVFLFSENIIYKIQRFTNKIALVGRIVNPFAQNWLDSIRYYKKNKKKVFYSLLLCIPIHTISFLIYYVLAVSIGIDIGFFEMTFAIAIMWLITAVPISVGGMGVRELSLVWLLGMFGVSSEQAVSLSMLGYINALLKSMLALPLLLDFRNKQKINTGD